MQPAEFPLYLPFRYDSIRMLIEIARKFIHRFEHCQLKQLQLVIAWSVCLCRTKFPTQKSCSFSLSNKNWFARELERDCSNLISVCLNSQKKQFQIINFMHKLHNPPSNCGCKRRENETKVSGTKKNNTTVSFIHNLLCAVCNVVQNKQKKKTVKKVRKKRV